MLAWAWVAACWTCHSHSSELYNYAAFANSLGDISSSLYRFR